MICGKRREKNWIRAGIEEKFLRAARKRRGHRLR